jgi:hypothetical protein
MNCFGDRIMSQELCMKSYIHKCQETWLHSNMSKYLLFPFLAPTLLFLSCLYNKGHLLYHKTNTSFLNLKMWIKD